MKMKKGVDIRKTELPEAFKNMIKELLGEGEGNLLLTSLDDEPVTAVRLNKRKPGAIFENTSPVKWCDSGFYLKERPEFIFDPLLHAGAYYVQDASSMIYETVMKKIVCELASVNGDTKLRVLDLCAAPGGKTTAMINALPDGCEITANEYSRKRIGALQENMERWGYPNVKVTNKDSYYYAGLKQNFDVVAVDAPCSGEGMMRKEEAARSQWSEELVNQCSVLQKEILENAVEALKPGGFLIYSTCTFNRTENEENADFIFKELGLHPYDLKFPKEWGIPEGIETNLPVYRFMPHKTKGEGLFLSVFRKPGDWIPSEISDPLKKRADINPIIEVDKAAAIKYLRGESLILPPDAPKGIVTISYMGYPLGEAKNIGSRANNLYPKNRRILKNKF